MGLLSLFLLAIAVCSFVSATPDRLPALALGPYWIASLLGQLLAFPLVFVAIALTLYSTGWECWVSAGAGILFCLVHLRNRRGASLLLRATGGAQTVPWHAGALPFLTGGRGIRRSSNLSYGTNGRRNVLDVVIGPAHTSGSMPVLIHFHGGAWSAGDRNQQAKPLLNHMARRGWVCFDATYRLGPANRGPDWIIDALQAIAWVRSHAAEYGGDPDRIAITGGSAGGHLAALAALVHDDAAFKPGFEDADCSVAAAVPLYGRYDFLDREHWLKRNHSAVIDEYMTKKVMPAGFASCPDLWHAVSPIDRVRPDAPPMLIIHGTGDTMLPWQDARAFAEALRAKSDAPVSFVALPGIQHAWDSASSALTWGHVRAVAAFLAPLEKKDQPFLATAVRGLR